MMRIDVLMLMLRLMDVLKLLLMDELMLKPRPMDV
jgi:hypothetical protein